MTAEVMTALAVLAAGAALRPRPRARQSVGECDVDRGAAGPTHLVHAIRRRTRRSSVDAASVAVWCESLARVIRSGSTLTSALHTTAPPQGAEPIIEPILLQLRRGGRLVDALATSTSHTHLNLALNVLRACALEGGPPAEPLDRAASTLRGRAADAAERRTHSAQARLSAVVMTVLPVAMLALLMTTSAGTRAAASSPIGTASITAGIVLNVAGWRWMRHIITKAQR